MMMNATGKETALASRSSRLTGRSSDPNRMNSYDRLWDWLSRPTHYRAVRRLLVAIENGNSDGLANLLDPQVAVVVEAGDPQHLARKVVIGTYDATAVLLQGMGTRNGTSITIRAVNGQAGFMLSDHGHTTATIVVDFTGGLVTTMWIRLHPYELRHWNKV